MTSFLDDNFLLNSPMAVDLFHQVARPLPIIDYHSHLPPAEIAQRKQFRNLTELWLGGDHYKWRLMRAAGVDESFITGSQPDQAKFQAFCKVLPLALGNPIYHWCHLELRRLFGIEEVVNERNADVIWTRANAQLRDMDTWSFLQNAHVKVACTTDDPADDLADHRQIAQSGLSTRVLPAYRPDRAMRLNRDDFADYLITLGAVAQVQIDSYDALIRALVQRIEYFHAQGARVSDHAIDTPLSTQPVDAAQAQSILAKRLAGNSLTEAELSAFQSRLLVDLGRVYAQHGWVMCLHIGAQRNNSDRGLATLGPDTGYDSISDRTHSAGLAALLNALDRTDQLPKTMLFCLNPAMNDALSTLTGVFQGGPAVGKLQFGPAWWFNDTKEGNLQQLLTLSQHGVLGSFVGMVTDSRSFASYPRHEYFRRLLCRVIGQWVVDGECPDDWDALSRVVSAVCYDNANTYFAL